MAINFPNIPGFNATQQSAFESSPIAKMLFKALNEIGVEATIIMRGKQDFSVKAGNITGYFEIGAKGKVFGETSNIWGKSTAEAVEFYKPSSDGFTKAGSVTPTFLKNDSIRRQVLLESLKQNEADKFLKYLNDIEKSIRLRLAGEGLTIASRQRLDILLKGIIKIETETFNKFTGELNTLLDDVAISEANSEVQLLQQGVRDAEFVMPADKQILTAFRERPLSLKGRNNGLTMQPFIKNFTDEQIQFINGRIAQGFAEGQTTAQIASALRGTAANGYADGIYAVVDRNAKVMIRTALQNAASIARQEIWNENSDFIVGVEWVSTLDDRTTEECQALDGEIFPVDSGPRPPIHYGCRSTTSPVLPDDLQVLNEGAERPAIGETAAGKESIKQVSSKTTYYEWLKTQPTGFQEKVLGKDKALLFNSGGLSAEKFRSLQLNKNFKPLSLSDIADEAVKARDEVVIKAFEKADLSDYLQK